MKKFIIRNINFILLFLIFTYALAYIVKTTNLYKEFVNGKEIYYSIQKSEQKNNSKKLLLGDSVGNQLFPNSKNDEPINSLACNQSISLVGHYILLKNYLNSGNHVDTVFLLYAPSSFSNNLDEKYTYHYFLKPFYKKEYKTVFTEEVNRQIKKIPYYRFCRLPYILTTNWAPDYGLENNTEEISNTFLSPISVEYLKRIRNLSKKFDFEFIILAPPINEKKKTKLLSINRKKISDNDLEGLFTNYFQGMRFLNDSNFYPDGVHLLQPEKYTEYYTEYFGVENKVIGGTEKNILAKK